MRRNLVDNYSLTRRLLKGNPGRTAPRTKDLMPPSSPKEPIPTEPVEILVLNHHRDDLTASVAALRQRGYAPEKRAGKRGWRGLAPLGKPIAVDTSDSKDSCSEKSLMKDQ